MADYSAANKILPTTNENQSKVKGDQLIITETDWTVSKDELSKLGNSSDIKSSKTTVTKSILSSGWETENDQNEEVVVDNEQISVHTDPINSTNEIHNTAANKVIKIQFSQ